MTTPRVAIFLTSRADTLVLHSTSDVARTRHARRGEPLLMVDRLPGGFVDLEYDDERWFALHEALAPWSGREDRGGRSLDGQLWSARGLVQQPPYVPPETERPAYDPAPYVPVLPPVQPAWTPMNVEHPCASCGRGWGGGRSCQFCRQVVGLPVGVHLSSPAKRFGAYLLEGAIMLVTLVIGWLVWSLVVYKDGRTPAKQLLGMRVVNLRTSEPATWGRMFLREFIAKGVIGLISLFTFGVGGIVSFWLIWDKDHQELWDKFAGTVVVDDGDAQL